MSAELESLTTREIAEKMKTIANKGIYEEEKEGYRIGSRDWEELQELIDSLRRGEEKTESEHRFADSEKCVGCGMTEVYYKQALSILQEWPENSERNERIAELKACSNERTPKSGAHSHH